MCSMYVHSVWLSTIQLLLFEDAGMIMGCNELDPLNWQFIWYMFPQQHVL